MRKFGDVLKELIEEREDLNQVELSKILNVEKATVSNWINKRRFPEQGMLTRIADHFDVSLDYLLGRSEMKRGRILKAKEISEIFPESVKIRYLANDDLEIEINENELSEETKEELLRILRSRNIY